MEESTLAQILSVTTKKERYFRWWTGVSSVGEEMRK